MTSINDALLETESSESDTSQTESQEETVKKTQASPVEQLGFEISPQRAEWTFVPEFYPDSFTQMKKKELDRYGGNCNGESVSIKSIKNRELHATGVILQGEAATFRSLQDINSKVDLISPLTSDGGMECYVKKAELGEQKGWDPHTRQWMFEYTIDLVSTGRDEYGKEGDNAIVTAITAGKSNKGETGTNDLGIPYIIDNWGDRVYQYKDTGRQSYDVLLDELVSGEDIDDIRSDFRWQWMDGQMTTEEFVSKYDSVDEGDITKVDENGQKSVRLV